MHSPPHPFRRLGWYLITAATFEHRPILQQESRLQEFQSRMLDRLSSAPARILAWVVLPSHYHCVVQVEQLELLSRSIGRLHGGTARDWNREENLTGKRRVWYKFTDRGLRGHSMFRSALNYVHVNPVKHGYVARPEEWRWSSVHWYLEHRGRAWLRENWKRHPIGILGDYC